MIAETPSIYNGVGICENDSGGVYNGRGVYNGTGKNIVEFGGIEYGFVKIGNLLWTTENLKNYTTGALYYNNSDDYKDLGYLYKTISIIKTTNTQSDFIQSIVHDGWRVPTKADFETLLNYPLAELKDKLNSWPTNGTNETGFNCYRSGTRGHGGAWDFSMSVFISQSLVQNSTAYYFIMTNTSRQVLSNVSALVDEGQRLRSVRLCCDA